MFRSSNPALGESTFLDLSSGIVSERIDGMTLGGTANKTGILLLLAVLTGWYAWSHSITPAGEVAADIMVYIAGGAIGGFVMAIATIFKKTWAPVTAPAYALFEGLFLGAISGLYDARFHGIVLQAVLLTVCTLTGMLFAYRSGLIRATESFKLGVVAATGGIALIYLLTLVLGFFGVQVPYLHESGPIGIAFSLFVVGVAALNLVLDFDFIESGVEAGAPKYMEWYGAFSLMVTLVWLYLEFLRLLSKLRR